MCWGHTSVNKSETITFPVSYTSNTYSIVAGMESTTVPGQTQAGAGGSRTSKSQAFIFSGSASHKGFWMTIGY